MANYSETLKAYLASGERSQLQLGEQVGVTQVTIHRYAAGSRFPDSSIAKLIDEKTDGAVPFALWQAEAMQRLGIAA